MFLTSLKGLVFLSPESVLKGRSLRGWAGGGGGRVGGLQFETARHVNATASGVCERQTDCQAPDRQKSCSLADVMESVSRGEVQRGRQHEEELVVVVE